MALKLFAKSQEFYSSEQIFFLILILMQLFVRITNVNDGQLFPARNEYYNQFTYIILGASITP